MDITVTGIDVERSTAIGDQPKPRQVVLNLSRTASDGWCDEFNAAWREQIYMTKCAATADGAEITVGCRPEQLECHLEKIRAVIEHVNEDRRKRLAAYKAEQKRLEQREASRDNGLQALNERLFS